MDKERFGINKGRKRPPYKPQSINCPGCGAGLTIKDERSELVVCEFCGSHLDVSSEEKTVLGKGASKKWDFPLKVGDSFRQKGSRFEIIARLVFIEDNDVSEASRDYLLYNPRHGTMWLSEYHGQYSLSQDSHIMPTTDPFDKRRGSVLKTHDGREWVTEGKGTYELAYVDGALPWIAKVGDRIRYAEFTEKSGSGVQYEVQRIKNEVEYGTGRKLSLQMVRRATKKPNLGDAALQDTKNIAQSRNLYLQIITFAVIALIINGFMMLSVRSKGNLVFKDSFSAQQLNEETISQPFKISQDGNIIKVIAKANVNNAWMAVDIGLIKDEDTIIHVYDNDISYYHGVEGGESWSEGGTTETTYIKIPKAGSYRLLVHAVSASGNAATSTEARHGLSVKVIDGALVPKFFIFAAILSAIVLILGFIALQKLNKDDDD